ncbi:hypothetical protein, partial [Corynebacterium matruchotii]|uniref:hypothetical protein n=1 Tax=Corynebacterium matruchotii TaxID=43768 RepID=UPI0024312FF8
LLPSLLDDALPHANPLPCAHRDRTFATCQTPQVYQMCQICLVYVEADTAISQCYMLPEQGICYRIRPTALPTTETPLSTREAIGLHII